MATNPLLHRETVARSILFLESGASELNWAHTHLKKICISQHKKTSAGKQPIQHCIVLTAEYVSQQVCSDHPVQIIQTFACSLHVSWTELQAWQQYCTSHLQLKSTRASYSHRHSLWHLHRNLIITGWVRDSNPFSCAYRFVNGKVNILEIKERWLYCSLRRRGFCFQKVKQFRLV